MFLKNPLPLSLLSIGWFLLSVQPAAAQYPYPSVYAPYAGPGGYMAGQAEVINAYGGFQTQQQQAQILNQQALQDQIKTKKMQFDFDNYEASNTPTFGMTQEQIKKQKEYRILTNPTQSEIVNGQAFNILLPYLQNMANKGVPGIPVQLAPGVISKINVTAPFSSGSPGILKNPGKLDFPIVLKGPTQQLLAEQVNQAVSMCANDTLDFQYYKKVTGTLAKLRDENVKKFQKEEIDGGEYLIGNRYLDSLEDSVKLLQQPNAATYFNGSAVAKGSTVPELIYSMTKQGLQFAPCTPGNEAAYMSLYNSMLTFSTMAQNGGGFQVQMGPAHQQGFSKAAQPKQ